MTKFQRDGHILLRGLAMREEIARFRLALCATASKYSTETRSLAERNTYGRAFLQTVNG